MYQMKRPSIRFQLLGFKVYFASFRFIAVAGSEFKSGAEIPPKNRNKNLL